MPNEEVEILLVEDSPEDVELTMHALRRAKLANQIHLARDGEEALDFLFCRNAYRERAPAPNVRLVLLDLKLPKVDGQEVLRQIKADPSTRSIPVVVLTSSKEERDLMQSYQLGVNSYIQKPVDFDRFREVIEQIGLYWLVVNEVPPVKPAAAEAK